MPKTEKTATAKEPKQFPAPEPKLSGPAFKPAEYRRTSYFATPAVGITVDHLLKPVYWSHVAGKLRPLDRIEAVPEDGAWWAEFLVLRVVGNGAQVMVLNSVKLDETADEDLESETHEVKWRGPAAKWSVMRKSDGTVIKDGLDSKALAAAWVAENMIERKVA